MLADDPEAPTTIKERFDYGPLTGGPVRGSVVVDPGSIDAFDPLAGRDNKAAIDASSAPARRQASNFQLVSPQRSATGNSLAVMGPQLGYYYPEIVQQIHLHGPGINAQGAAVPGLAMYILIGRTNNYAWSLTSAGHDVRDVRGAAVQPRRRQGDAQVHRLRVQGQVPPDEGLQRRHAGQERTEVQDDRARPGDRDRDGQGQALRARSQALDVRPRQPQPRGAQGHERGQGGHPEEVPASGQPVRLHLQLGVRLPRYDGQLLLRPAAGTPARTRPPPADPRQREMGVEGLPRPGRSPQRRGRSRQPAAELEQPVRARLHARRRRALRLGPARRAVRPLPGEGDARRRERDEPRRDRGRAHPCGRS